MSVPLAGRLIRVNGGWPWGASRRRSRIGLRPMPWRARLQVLFGWHVDLVVTLERQTLTNIRLTAELALVPPIWAERLGAERESARGFRFGEERSA